MRVVKITRLVPACESSGTTEMGWEAVWRLVGGKVENTPFVHNICIFYP